MRVLVVNAGSSTLKLSVLGDDGDEPLATDHIDRWDRDDVTPISRLLESVGSVDAFGHRVVHGGTALHNAVVIDAAVINELRALTPLAPLHQGPSMAGIAAAQKAAPDVPHVACFDTAYHATLSDAAATYALPASWRERWPLRRFGFHGLSHAYAAAQVPVDQRVVTCHLGAGASLCASVGRRSVDTTMGFTPLEGLVMATRSGSVDPGLVLWLIIEAGLSADEVSDQLLHGAGLAGLAGTSDMREVVARRAESDPAATLAFDVYIHVLVQGIAAMTASLGGLDTLIFTGGVGEHSPDVRSATVERLDHLSPFTTHVVEAREDLEIARSVRHVLAT